MEPLDPESGEDTDSIEEGVSTSPPGVPQNEDGEPVEDPLSNPLRDSMRSGKSNVGAGVGTPAKPQPDPWADMVRGPNDTVPAP